MAILPPDGRAVSHPPAVRGLDRILRGLSVFTLLMTAPQVFTIWANRDAHNVSLLSWAAYLLSASLWFVYGIQKHDKTIYVACVGWIVLDLAIVVGVIAYG